MIFALVPGQFNRVIEVGDLPIMVQPDPAAKVGHNLWCRPRHDLLANGEHLGVLEKEVAFLREEQGEAGVVQSSIVHLCFSKVGVQRQVCRPVRLETIADVAPEISGCLGVGDVSHDVRGHL